MKIRRPLIGFAFALAFLGPGYLDASQCSAQDSRGDDFASWLNQRGREVWGEPPQRCDDLTFARRIYLDVLGRVPSVPELRDYENLRGDRRRILVDQLVFAEGERSDDYSRLAAQQLARHWRKILLPTSSTATGLEGWLAEKFSNRVSYRRMMRSLIELDEEAGPTQYFQLSGNTPEGYAGNLSRALLGVQIECAQCHDHPFTEWKLEDFWGLAAFYGGAPGNAGSPSATPGKITADGVEYPAKLLWSDEPLTINRIAARSQLGDWFCSPSNPQFAANAVNRFWQYLVGRGLYADAENLDQASAEERKMLNEFGDKFAEQDFAIGPLIAAICKSDWYQSISQRIPTDPAKFYRPLKSISPEQVFDSMEQSLLLPISRVDMTSPRWSGERMQLVSRLGEAAGGSPEDYLSGIPQALAIMNGKITSDATDLDKSKLLRAVIDSPFFGAEDRVEVVYLAVLSRRPTATESAEVHRFLHEETAGSDSQEALGEVLWALINSPEFVLCR